MTDQDKLIGEHRYENGEVFSEWLIHEDRPATHRKKHRILSENIEKRKQATDKLGDWLIRHHVKNKKIDRLREKKKILNKHEFKKYAQSLKFFPKEDKTKKGNVTEVILAEYLKFSSGLDILVYRLRYNQNVDQSLKGDDVLLFEKENLRNKILVGEAKYRSTPNKKAVKDIIHASEGDKKLPISIPFVADRLSDMGQEELAEKLEDLNFELSKLKTRIVNVGMLLGNKKTPDVVEDHCDSVNPNFLMLSLGIANPFEIIDEGLEKAIKSIENEPI